MDSNATNNYIRHQGRYKVTFKNWNVRSITNVELRATKSGRTCEPRFVT